MNTPYRQLPPVPSGGCSRAPAIVEFVEVLAKSESIPLSAVAVDIQGSYDRSRPVRPDVSLFNSVRLHFRMKGVSPEQGRVLVEAFKGR